MLNFALEFVSNGSLADIIKKFGAFPETLVTTYTAQVRPRPGLCVLAHRVDRALTCCRWDVAGRMNRKRGGGVGGGAVVCSLTTVF